MNKYSCVEFFYIMSNNTLKLEEFKEKLKKLKHQTRFTCISFIEDSKHTVINENIFSTF